MNAMITASTTWPAIMLAKRRTANTPCFTNSPNTSITKIMGTRKILIGPGRSMCGTCAFQNPTGPSLFMPEPITTKNVINASAPVTASEPGRRTHPGNHAEQIAAEDEEENRPQEWHETVGIVVTDAGPGDVVAEVQQHRFEHVAEAAAGQPRRP